MNKDKLVYILKRLEVISKYNIKQNKLSIAYFALVYGNHLIKTYANVIFYQSSNIYHHNLSTKNLLINDDNDNFADYPISPRPEYYLASQDYDPLDCLKASQMLNYVNQYDNDKNLDDEIMSDAKIMFDVYSYCSNNH